MKTRHMTLTLVLWLVLLFVPCIVSANSITGPQLHGLCLTLPELQAYGPMEWFYFGDLEAASFSDPEPGCEPTTRRASSLLTAIDVDGGTLVRLNPASISSSECGRRQFDLRAPDVDLRLYFMLNLFCMELSPPEPPPGPPPDLEPGPPGPIPPEDLPPPPEDTPPPDDVPPVTEIPEPASLALLGAGVGLLAARIRQARERRR